MQLKFSKNSVLYFLFCSLLLAFSSTGIAQTLQVDLKPLLNARVVSVFQANKLTNWTRGVDVEWSGLATMSAAKKLGTKSPMALPDNGFVTSNSKHPEVQLNFNNKDALSKQVRLSAAEDSFAIQLKPQNYNCLDIFVMSANGESKIEVELIYEGWSDTKLFTIIDWATPAVENSKWMYNLIENLGKWNKKGELMEVDHHYIHGIKLNPSPKSILKGFIIKKSKPGTLTLWGATAVIASNDVQIVNINKNWQFAQENTQKWMDGTVPGCVHTDLLKHKIIEDPFFRLNEKEIQWVGKTGWNYKTTFNANNGILSKTNIQLIFDGLDTYADVYLNGTKIVSADNYFRSWPSDVKKLLKEKANVLEVKFKSVFEVNIPKWKAAPYRLEAFSNNDQADTCINMYSRKPGFHFGWDWGPRLITTGIWKPVFLKAWNNAKIENVWIQQNNINEKMANITAVFNINATTKQKGKVNISWGASEKIEQSIELIAGKNSINLPFSINNPNLWWSNGLGKANLYTFHLSVTNEKGEILDSEEVTTGLRSLRIVREKDALGKSLYVELNGKPVFMKGSCYIPSDNFQNRVTESNYEFTVKSAADANMNMLRVWGGGFYENSRFYELCDQYGILVWQDLMFACGMYPNDEAYVQNVKAEIEENVTRLRNFACIALYCGNNENEIAWHNWGWKQKFDKSAQDDYENGFNHLFYKVIPDALKASDSLRFYHPSSPISGFKANGTDRPYSEGDIHYWGVWHGKDPFAKYKQNIARFVSEYGFQSYPEFSSIKKFSIASDWNIKSDVMHSHQRCMADNRKDLDYGNRLILEYMNADYKVPTDFEQFLYVNQVLQAEGVKIGFEAHRRNMANRYCMGSLFWQINDCWPVASWSSIDYYGKWKALHYFSKKGFVPVLVSPLVENDSLKVFVISDKRANIKTANLKLKLFETTGKLLWSDSKSIEVKSNTSEIYWSSTLQSLIKDKDVKKLAFVVELFEKDSLLSENILHFVPVKDLTLEKTDIHSEVEKCEGGFKLKLSSKVLLKNLMLELPEEYNAFFSDNYFDLVPGREVSIIIKTTINTFDKTKLKMVTMADVK